MFRTILLELLLPFTSAQILHENKTKWRIAPKRKTGAAAKHSLKQTAQRRSHRLIEPSNHRTIETKTKNLKSLKSMVCCRLMPGSKNRTKKNSRFANK